MYTRDSFLKITLTRGMATGGYLKYTTEPLHCFTMFKLNNAVPFNKYKLKKTDFEQPLKVK